MLTQTYRRQIPETAAFVERTLFRDRHFCVAVVRAEGIAVDMGSLRGAVRHLDRFRRPQLTLVLAGRAYFEEAGRVTSLGAGDVLVTDPRGHDGEGYAGRPCEVITIESDAGVPGLPGRTSGRLSTEDVGALRLLVRERTAEAPERWIGRLSGRLAALGLVAERRMSDGASRAPERLERLYAAIGPALSHLDRHPSLPEIATTLGASERQVARQLGELAREYDHPFESWRELVHEMRLTWATQLLSVPDLPLARIASLAGYRSTIAMHHAFSLRGAATPTTIARQLAERWR